MARQIRRTAHHYDPLTIGLPVVEPGVPVRHAPQARQLRAARTRINRNSRRSPGQHFCVAEVAAAAGAVVPGPGQFDALAVVAEAWRKAGAEPERAEAG